VLTVWSSVLFLVCVARYVGNVPGLARVPGLSYRRVQETPGSLRGSQGTRWTNSRRVAAWRIVGWARYFEQVLHCPHLGTPTLRDCRLAGPLLAHPQTRDQWSTLVALAGVTSTWAPLDRYC